MRVLLAMAAFMPVASGAGPINGIWKSCAITSVSVCTTAGCRPAKPAISIYLLNFVDGGGERSAYFRCALGLTRCDRYSALVNKTGDFAIFSLPDRSLFAKLGPGERVTDVAAVGDTVFVSRGTCRDSVPPAATQLRSR